jgi:hypothetical protein
MQQPSPSDGTQAAGSLPPPQLPTWWKHVPAAAYLFSITLVVFAATRHGTSAFQNQAMQASFIDARVVVHWLVMRRCHFLSSPVHPWCVCVAAGAQARPGAQPGMDSCCTPGAAQTASPPQSTGKCIVGFIFLRSSFVNGLCRQGCRFNAQLCGLTVHLFLMVCFRLFGCWLRLPTRTCPHRALLEYYL